MHFWPTGCKTRNSVSQSTSPQQHTLDVMQILCSQCCAGFATNVSSDEGFTCSVNYLLNRKAIIHGDSVARGQKLLSIKNYVFEIMTRKFINT